MQIAAETEKFQSLPSAMLFEFSVTFWPSQLSRYRVIRRNGAVVSFEPSDVPVTVTEMFLADAGMHGAASAVLQLQVIDGGKGELLDRGRQTRRGPSPDQFMGPIG